MKRELEIEQGVEKTGICDRVAIYDDRLEELLERY